MDDPVTAASHGVWSAGGIEFSDVENAALVDVVGSDDPSVRQA
jgi:hypothetical protein